MTRMAPTINAHKLFSRIDVGAVLAKCMNIEYILILLAIVNQWSTYLNICKITTVFLNDTMARLNQGPF